MKERVTTTEAALILGLSRRKVQLMCIGGEIPGAARFGTKWTIHEATLRRWIAERETKGWPGGSSSAAASITAAFASRGASTDRMPPTAP